MNRTEILKRVRFLRRKVKFNSLIYTNKKYEVSLMWLHNMFLSKLNQIQYIVENENENADALRDSVQSVIDWYKSDEVHPITPLASEIKDVFWGSFEYIIGTNEFENNFKEQILQFYNSTEKPQLSIERIDFKNSSTKILPKQSNVSLLKIFLRSNTIFKRETPDKNILEINRCVNEFINKIFNYYTIGKLSQDIFSKEYRKLLDTVENEMDLIDSEDQDDLEAYLNEFSSYFGLNLTF